MKDAQAVPGRIVWGLLIALGVSSAAFAQETSTAAASLDFVSRNVYVQPGGEGDWINALPGIGLLDGDYVWADPDARAEISLNSGAVRMSAETGLTLLDLGNYGTRLHMTMGTVMVHWSGPGGSFSVETPNLLFSLQQPGDYRIDTNASGDESVLTVWAGRGEATGGGSLFVVESGQRASFGGLSHLTETVQELPDRDDFDTWAFSRDHPLQPAPPSESSGDDQSAEAQDYPDTRIPTEPGAAGHWHYDPVFGPYWAPEIWSELIPLPYPGPFGCFCPSAMGRGYGSYTSAVVVKGPRLQSWSQQAGWRRPVAESRAPAQETSSREAVVRRVAVSRPAPREPVSGFRQPSTSSPSRQTRSYEPRPVLRPSVNASIHPPVTPVSRPISVQSPMPSRPSPASQPPVRSQPSRGQSSDSKSQSDKRNNR